MEQVQRQKTQDRLTALPEALRLSILSLLPFKESVKTSILSTQWRFLWTNLQIIDLDLSELPDTDLPDILDGLQTRITSPVIHTFKLLLPSACDMNPRQYNFAPWLFRLSTKQVRTIDVRWVDTDTSPYSLPYDICGTRVENHLHFILPSSIFQSETLVSFNLWLDFDLPNDAGVINLPNLQNLSIYLQPSHSDFISNLITSCPRLDQLSLKAHGAWDILDSPHIPVRKFNIISPTLNRLHLAFDCIYNMNLSIDTPNLSWLCLIAEELNFNIITAPIALQELLIFTYSQPLFTSLHPYISQVPNLDILGTVFNELRIPGNNQIHVNQLNVRGLIHFLDYIEQFLLNEVSPIVFPSLKIVNLLVYNFTILEWRKLATFGEYILKNSPCLERLDFVAMTSSGPEPDLDEELNDDLSSLATSYPKCIIRFRAEHHRTYQGLVGWTA